MLRELRIRNLALFEDECIAFGPGLNAITGATGAGKSLLLQAVQLLLGGRFSRDVLRTGADTLEIEGRFELEPALAQIVADALDLPEIAVDQEVIVRRRVDASGRNRCETHGRLTPVSGLRELGRLLVEIHGQSEHQHLAESASQVAWFDRWAGLEAQRAAFADDLTAWRVTRAELASRTARAAEHAAHIANLRELLETVSRTEIDAGEQARLRSERALLADAERHVEALRAARTQLEGDDRNDVPGVLDVLGAASRGLEATAELHADIATAVEALDAAFARAADALQEIARAADVVRVDPERLEEVQDRLETIGVVLRRYGPSEEDAVERAAAAADELTAFDASGSDPQILKTTLARQGEALIAAGRALNDQRRSKADAFSAAVVTALSTLGMPGARFAVDVQDGPEDGDLDARTTSTGLGTLRFLVSPNAGEDLRELGRIASGGELARVALALKGELADADHVPTLVFDEVDADVGPRLGDVIGRKLAELAMSRQVLVVTHLAQVAAHGAVHVKIAKSPSQDRTVAHAETLTGTPRLRELAEMLRGTGKADAALDQAQQLLDEARTV